MAVRESTGGDCADTCEACSALNHAHATALTLLAHMSIMPWRCIGCCVCHKKYRQCISPLPLALTPTLTLPLNLTL